MIAHAMACWPVRVQTREYKDLVFHLTLLHLKVSFMMRLHHMKRLHHMMPFHHMTDFHHILQFNVWQKTDAGKSEIRF